MVLSGAQHTEELSKCQPSLLLVLIFALVLVLTFPSAGPPSQKIRSHPRLQVCMTPCTQSHVPKVLLAAICANGPASLPHWHMLLSDFVISALDWRQVPPLPALLLPAAAHPSPRSELPKCKAYHVTGLKGFRGPPGPKSLCLKSFTCPMWPRSSTPILLDGLPSPCLDSSSS